MHRAIAAPLGALACVAALAPSPAHAGERTATPAAPRTLTTRFTYVAAVPEVPAGTKSVRLWIPIPSNSEWQDISEIEFSALAVPIVPRITTEPKHGNRMIFVEVPNPTGPTTITASFTVKRKEIDLLRGEAAPVRAGSLERGRNALKSFLEADEKVPLGGRYAAIAREVAGGRTTGLDKARALYEHVVATMEYDYKKESPKLGEGDVAFVCDYKKGNCSDLHSYLISLSRSLGVPAVLEFGFPLTGIPVANPIPPEGTIGGYHCWAWFKDEQRGWLPLDASDGRRWLDSKRADVKDRLVGSLVLERSAVAFSRGRDLTLSPPQKEGALNYFIYPYAEADGKSVKTTWEVKYRLVEGPAVPFSVAVPAPAGTASAPVAPAAPAAPSIVAVNPLTTTAQDPVQRQLDELRRIVTEQARELANLRAAAARAAAQPQTPIAPPSPPRTQTTTAPPAPRGPEPVTTASREKVGFYGFVRVDGIYDSQHTNNAQTPFFVQSPSNANVVERSNGQFTLHPRLTRLGWNLAAPEKAAGGYDATGKIEIDFQNASGTTTESRPVPRLRHGYLQLQRGASQLLFGQTWDLISPLFPSPNDDTLMWNAGNLGDRRPQVRYTQGTASQPFSFAVAAGLSGALDAKDLDANGVRDGEDSGAPNLQTRLAWKAGKTTIGLWGHYGWERVTKLVAGRREFHSHSAGLDLQHALARQWDVRGELWTGSDLSDFRGGIGQGVNAASGSEIRSQGGWLELGFAPRPTYRLAVGYAEDNPKDVDIPAGGRSRNYSMFLSNRWRLAGGLEVGANYLYWLTNWKGLSSGIDHRINTFVQHNF